MMFPLTPDSNLNSSGEYIGMSDEEELKRAGLLHSNAGVGEVLVDYGDDFRELGIER